MADCLTAEGARVPDGQDGCPLALLACGTAGGAKVGVMARTRGLCGAGVARSCALIGARANLSSRQAGPNRVACKSQSRRAATTLCDNHTTRRCALRGDGGDVRHVAGVALVHTAQPVARLTGVLAAGNCSGPEQRRCRPVSLSENGCPPSSAGQAERGSRRSGMTAPCRKASMNAAFTDARRPNNSPTRSPLRLYCPQNFEWGC